VTKQAHMHKTITSLTAAGWRLLTHKKKQFLMQLPWASCKHHTSSLRNDTCQWTDFDSVDAKIDGCLVDVGICRVIEKFYNCNMAVVNKLCAQGVAIVCQ